MEFKSKAQIKKWTELVKQGKITKTMFDKKMSETKNPHKLPDRIGFDEVPKSTDDLRNLGAMFGVKKK